MSQKRILVVDDEKLICWSLRKMMQAEGYAAEIATSGAEACEKFHSFRPCLVLLDVCLPDANGIELMKQLREWDSQLPIIMITANVYADAAVQAFKEGAEGYIGKPFEPGTVKHAVRQALEKRQLKLEVDCARRRMRNKQVEDRLVGNSPEMIEVFKMIEVCAGSDAKTVLVLGESGTGKELVANAIHQFSAREHKPFVEVNCAAIPETLLENELFGHERGAYTDAGQVQKGIFECANGGTVFLDEIGDMPLQMQAKILKVIETKRFRRLGGKEDLAADVRIIAATNQDLPEMVRQKKFRGDLFYRLNVMNISLHPLRERKGDIPNLVEFFIERLNQEYGRHIEGVAPETLKYLKRYDWPGNVRELRNVIERAMMLEKGRLLSPGYLNLEVRQGAGQSSEHEGGVRADSGFTLPPEGVVLEDVERSLILQALDRAQGNRTQAAQLLGMSRDTLRYRMKKFAITETEAAEGGQASDADSQEEEASFAAAGNFSPAN